MLAVLGKAVLVGALAMPLLDSCSEDMTLPSDQRMNQLQEQTSNEAAMNVGFPAIRNFQEKRMMKQILELRDTTISTTAYLQDLNGRLHFFCNSVGYGLPYATQYTNPQKVAAGCNSNHCGVVTIPQADPNGLFSPANADGTWVLCRDPDPDPRRNRGTIPVYVEPHVVVSPFPLPQAVRD